MLKLTRNILIAAAGAGLSLSAGGCATHTGEGALAGGATGAGLGAIIGHNSHGRTLGGALIGGAIGALIGGAIGQQQDIAEGVPHTYQRDVYIYDSRPRVYYSYPGREVTEYRVYDPDGRYRVTRQERDYYAPYP
jgi:hypothetical protein